METYTIKAGSNEAGLRLDKALARLLPDISRSRLQALIDQGHVVCDGLAVANASVKLRGDELFEVNVPAAVDAAPQPQDIKLDIVYEDQDLLVINKAADMVVHPAAGNHDGTLVNALLAHCGAELSGIGGVKRPGIVHRLDKETSGLMVVAKNDVAHHGLSEQLSSRTLKRVYQALVWGNLSPREGVIETNIGRSKTNRQKMAVLDVGGKEAITGYTALENYGVIASLVECRLQTGRTHQIRVHMAHIRHWLLGDKTYGMDSARKFLRLQKVDDETVKKILEFPRQALHAVQLEFIHPVSKNRMSFSVDLPEDMKALRKVLKSAFGGNR